MARKYFLKIKKKKDHGLTEKDYERIRNNLKDPVYINHLIDRTAEKIIDEIGQESLSEIMFGEK